MKILILLCAFKLYFCSSNRQTKPLFIHFCQSLKRRISEIRISRRPTPVSVDPDVLGTELKVRLAAAGHNLRSDVKPSTGRYVFNNHSRIHQVALHEISDEQDCSVMCSRKSLNAV